MRPTDPRVVAVYNRAASNLESVQSTAQSIIYSASHHAEPYVSSCLASVSTCLEASCQPCFNLRDENYRRRGHHPSRTVGARRGREGLGFDFYDDWEQEEAEWANDELERLLGNGEEEGDGQPGKKPPMSYGSRLSGRVTGKRKTIPITSKDAGEDPNVVPQSSIFGFLERLPWKIGGRGSGKYRPSVADLQERVGRRGPTDAERVLFGDGEAEIRKGRGRSGTAGSRSSLNSLSSRGDLFPSDDEDAVPIDDEFAMALERRPTGATTSDDRSSRKKGAREPAGSRASIKTVSSRDNKPSRKKGKRGSSASSREVRGGLIEALEPAIPSMTDLKLEEDRISREQEAAVEQRRQAAQLLAAKRGLATVTAQEVGDEADEATHSKSESSVEATEVEEADEEEEINALHDRRVSTSQMNTNVFNLSPRPKRSTEAAPGQPP